MPLVEIIVNKLHPIGWMDVGEGGDGRSGDPRDDRTERDLVRAWEVRLPVPHNLRPLCPDHEKVTTTLGRVRGSEKVRGGSSEGAGRSYKEDGHAAGPRRSGGSCCRRDEGLV